MSSTPNLEPRESADPAPGTVRNRREVLRLRRPKDYPLHADCADCGLPIAVADGTAAWYHLRTNRAPAPRTPPPSGTTQGHGVPHRLHC